MDLHVPTPSVTAPDADARRSEMEALALIDTAESVQRLIEGLCDPVRGVRAAAFDSLEQLRCPDVYSALVNALNQKNLVLRNAASLLLINMQLRAVPALVPALKSADHDVRKFVVDILGLIPDNGADAALVSLLHDPDDNVRISVIESLGNMHAHRAVPELLAVFADEELMRVTVCEALGKIGGDVCEEFLLQHAREQKSMEECDDLLVATILEALALCGTEKSVDFLHESLGDPDAELQHAAMYALISIHRNIYGTTEELRGYVVSLTAMLHSNNDQHAAAAARTLAAFPEADALQSILSVAGHSPALDQILVQAIGGRSSALEEIIMMVVQNNEGLEAAQWSVLLTVFREHMSVVQQAGAETVEQVFGIFASLRGTVYNEQRALLDDILMMLDYERAMELEDAAEGGVTNS